MRAEPVRPLVPCPAAIGAAVAAALGTGGFALAVAMGLWPSRHPFAVVARFLSFLALAAAHAALTAPPRRGGDGAERRPRLAARLPLLALAGACVAPFELYAPFAAREAIDTGAGLARALSLEHARAFLAACAAEGGRTMLVWTAACNSLALATIGAFALGPAWRAPLPWKAAFHLAGGLGVAAACAVALRVLAPGARGAPLVLAYALEWPLFALGLLAIDRLRGTGPAAACSAAS